MHSKSGPGGALYHYGLCELAQRQAVLMRKDKSSDRAIKSDRAKVVMTAGCISIKLYIPNYIYILREIANSANQKLLINVYTGKSMEVLEFLCYNLVYSLYKFLI